MWQKKPRPLPNCSREFENFWIFSQSDILGMPFGQKFQEKWKENFIKFLKSNSYKFFN
jgi:hypothetical protein